MGLISSTGRKVFVIVVFGCAGIRPGELPAAGGDARAGWLTGNALENQLARGVEIYWSEIPLRRALQSLSRNRRVAVLLDRRVDPEQRLSLECDGVPAEDVLRQVARQCDLGLSRLGPVVYLGPPRFAARLRTLAQLRREEIGRLGRPVATKFFDTAELKWDDFATPRELLNRLGAESETTIAGLELVPHDLWAAGDLPALALVDRLTLIVGQFDLTFRVAGDGRTVTLVRVPDEVALVRSYPGGGRPEELAKRWASRAPQSQFKVVGEKIYVKGPLEDHERIAGAGREPRRQVSRPAARGEASKRYTVREAKGALGSLLEQLAERMQVELEIDRDALARAGISLEQQISFSVEEATGDEVFRAVLAPAGCTFERDGNTIRIGPAR